MEESEKPILVPDQKEMVKEIFEIKPSTNDRMVHVILSQRIEDLKKLILSVKIKLFVC
jgi:GTP:adenosylcobinamide-phosphate guanylyltransferase